jgi:hypothetical protein
MCNHRQPIFNSTYGTGLPKGSKARQPLLPSLLVMWPPNTKNGQQTDHARHHRKQKLYQFHSSLLGNDAELSIYCTAQRLSATMVYKHRLTNQQFLRLSNRSECVDSAHVQYCLDKQLLITTHPGTPTIKSHDRCFGILCIMGSCSTLYSDRILSSSAIYPTLP